MFKKFLAKTLLTKALVGCSRGATTIEYALIASLISIAGISGMSSLGEAMNESYTSTASKL